MLGIVLKQTGDLDGALAELKEAIRLDPTTPGPFNTLGQILRIKGDKQGSEEAFAAGARLKREKEGELANSLETRHARRNLPEAADRAGTLACARAAPLSAHFVRHCRVFPLSGCWPAYRSASSSSMSPRMRVACQDDLRCRTA